MKIDLSEVLEQALLGRCVTALIDEGYRVQLSNTDGGGLFLYAMPDGAEFPRATSGGIHHWIKLVHGNGADLISDYSTNLETVLAPVNAFAALFQD